MEQLSFSQKPDDKVFFSGPLTCLSRAAAARTSRRIRPAISRPNNLVKISTST